ncbi:MAG TPA: ABC transporter permease subunit [Acidimicrobiia bacterium]|nr:ABC transporter permease subunit [Acidimicrobiia bacterium]
MAEQQTAWRIRTQWMSGWIRAVLSFFEARLGLAILTLFTLMALAHPLLLRTVWPRAIYDPRAGFDWRINHPSSPSLQHLLGTDVFGKDTFSMLMAGTRPALIAGVLAGLVTALVAISVAAFSSAFRPADRILGVLVDAALYLPVPVVMLIFGADPRADRLTPVIFGLLFGLLTGLSSGALVLRAQALPIMTSGFVDASRVAGASNRQVITRHLIPALIPIAGAYVVLGAAGAVVTQGFLSWLSYTATYNDWGTLVYWAIVTRDFSGRLLWHVLIAAGAALTLLTLAFHLLSIGFRKAAAHPWSSLPPDNEEEPAAKRLAQTVAVSS